MNENNNFLNLINIADFVLGVMNLQENLTQSDKQDIVDKLGKESDIILNKIHEHLEQQDKKIDRILEILEKNCNSFLAQITNPSSYFTKYNLP